jgi:hypothetical protein
MLWLPYTQINVLLVGHIVSCVHHAPVNILCCPLHPLPATRDIAAIEVALGATLGVMP